MKLYVKEGVWSIKHSHVAGTSYRKKLFDAVVTDSPSLFKRPKPVFHESGLFSLAG